MQPFEIHEKTTQAQKQNDECYITREFPILLSPRSIAALRLSGEEIKDARRAGIVNMEHEVVIDPMFSEGFNDIDDINVYDYNVLALDDIELSKNDSLALRDYLGELTEEELDAVKQSVFDNADKNPDYKGDMFDR